MKPRRLHSATTFSMVTLSSAIRGACWHSYTGSAVPIYEYRCENSHTFEVMQRMTEEPVTSCEVCGAPVQRVFHPVAVHFKGKGFYNTDYGTKRRNRELEKSGNEGADKTESKAAGKDPAPSGSGSGSSSGSSDSGSSSSKPAAGKPAAKD